MANRVALLAAGLILRAALPDEAAAWDARVRWRPSDGTNVKGYGIYTRQAGLPYGSAVKVGLPALRPDGTMSYVVTGLEDAVTYYFTVVAYARNGGETALSNQIPVGAVDPCVIDRCESASECQLWTRDDGTPCDDGLFCNGPAWCAAGRCVAGAPPNCSDGIACTVDTCDEVLGRCRHVSSAGCCTSRAHCLDTDPCTTNEACVSGKCVSTPLNCPDATCGHEVCDPRRGCGELTVWDDATCFPNVECAEGMPCPDETCGSVIVLPASGGTFSGTTAGASLLASGCSATGEAPDQVFEFVPSTSGVAIIDTCGGDTTFDTVLSLRGQDCADGPELACNDDFCADASGQQRASRITPVVNAGQRYLIVVDGYGKAAGDFKLNVVPPATCSSPPVIPAAGGTFRGTTAGVGSQAGSCGGAGAAEAAFQWTPARSGVATIGTCGSETQYDSVVYMRRASCAAGSEVACSDDGCANASGAAHASRIRPTVTAGQRYFIFVDGFQGDRGEFTLTVTPP
jgi:hypothetical protein